MLRRLRRLAIAALVLAGLLALAYVFRAQLCRSAGYTWAVHEPVEKADAVVLLGGGTEWRPFEAAAMYRQGQVPLVLVPTAILTPSVKIGARVPDTEVDMLILTKSGVPASSIQSYVSSPQSCRDEARGLHDWVAKNQVKSVVIPTDPFNTRRVKWIFERELKGTGVSVHVVTVSPLNYDLDDWWQKEDGVLNFITEGIKMTYYLVHY